MARRAQRKYESPFMKLSKKIFGVGGAVLVMAALIVWFWVPKPVPVDLVQVQKGELTVTIDEQGKTRAGIGTWWPPR